MSSIPIPFLALAVLGAFEYYLASTFVPSYFRFGIPLFVVRIPAHEAVLPEFEGRLANDFTVRQNQPIDFARLSPTEIAFAERWVNTYRRTVAYVAIMHGLIRLSPEEGTLSVIGWLNWSYVGIPVVLWMEKIPWKFDAFVAVGAAMMYGIQAARYRAIVADLSRAKA